MENELTVVADSCSAYSSIYKLAEYHALIDSI